LGPCGIGHHSYSLGRNSTRQGQAHSAIRLVRQAENGGPARGQEQRRGGLRKCGDPSEIRLRQPLGGLYQKRAVACLKYDGCPSAKITNGSFYCLEC